jgi:hypothetical protein
VRKNLVSIRFGSEDLELLAVIKSAEKGDLHLLEEQIEEKKLGES